MNDDLEKALWAAVTKDVRRLKPESPKSQAIQASSACAPSPAPIKTERSLDPAFRDFEKKPLVEQHPAQGLDRRTREKLRKGHMKIEARLDLHGLGQARAYEALGGFIRQAYASGQRCVLVITGKGRTASGALRGPLDKGDGILKRRVPEWLGEAALKPLILRTEPAQPKHGGDGALYVYLRRDR